MIPCGNCGKSMVKHDHKKGLECLLILSKKSPYDLQVYEKFDDMLKLWIASLLKPQVTENTL